MVIDLSTIDTTPGGAGPLAPPASVADEAAFFHWAKDRLRADPLFRQLVGILSMELYGRSQYFSPPIIVGPYADALRRLVDHVRRRCQRLAAAEASEADPVR